MKEFDYTKWDDKPREMWVWDNNENSKCKHIVVHVNPNKEFYVLTDSCSWYKHCAEIEPTRRMTYYELAHWLWEGTQVGGFRELRDGSDVSYNCRYLELFSDKPVSKNIEIRINGGEWKEPLIEA